MRLLTNVNTVKRGQSKRLVLAVHGWTHTSSNLHHLRAAIETSLPDADLLLPDFPSRWYSGADLVEITEELVELLDQAVVSRSQEGGNYEDIVLVGHSLGALLIRKTFLFANGFADDAHGSLRRGPKAWASLVSRAVLLAGTNRGWQIETRSRHMPLWKWWVFRAAAGFWRWFRVGGLINAARRGAPFVANLRVQWLNMINAGHRMPLTIQLLGTVDDVVSEEDNVDVQSGADFVYLQVPDSGHANVIDFSGPKGAAREQVFKHALLAPRDQLKSDLIAELVRDRDVKRVVFIMHGIRDVGHWTTELGRAIEVIATEKGEAVKYIASGYGYFPIMSFLLQPERQDNVRWFMDQYTEALARYPNASFDFVGHSNGTYLATSALERYKACKLDRLVFAGSVARRDFPWSSLGGRIGAIQNYVATHDWVVALFPAGFEVLNIQDLGSADHNGFVDDMAARHELRFVKGAHGAGIHPKNFSAIGRFIVFGDAEAARDTPLRCPERSKRLVRYSKFCILLWMLIAAIVSVVIASPVWWWPWLMGYVWPAEMWWIVSVGLGALVYLILRWI